MFLDTVSQRWTAAIGVLLVALYSAALAWAFETQSYNVWGSLLVALLVVSVNVILIWQVALRVDDPWIVRVIGLGFALKMLGSLARYAMVFVLYEGGGDSARYNDYASYQHVLWRRGFFETRPTPGGQGTQNLETVTTAVYTIIGPAPLAGFLVFGSFAFWGMYFAYRAFRIAVPDGHHRLYAALVFLLPSLLFWPSSIGKEAWLTLWVGVFALGAAKFFVGQRWALGLLALSIAATLAIRPHITVLLVAALLVAQLFRPVGTQAIGILYKVAGVAVLAAAAVLMATQSAEFLGLDDLSVESITERIEEAGENTEQGGSAFQPVPLDSPLGIPAAVVTLLIRPFPWEASGAPMLMQSVEGLLLIALIVRFWPRVKQLPRVMRTNPYVVFVLIYSIAFMLAFAGFSNFGIVARQRTLMIPLVVVLLALPAASSVAHSVRRGRARRAVA